METLEIALDDSGNKVVVLPDIIFMGKQKIDMTTKWKWEIIVFIPAVLW